MNTDLASTQVSNIQEIDVDFATRPPYFYGQFLVKNIFSTKPILMMDKTYIGKVLLKNFVIFAISSNSGQNLRLAHYSTLSYRNGKFRGQNSLCGSAMAGYKRKQYNSYGPLSFFITFTTNKETRDHNHEFRDHPFKTSANFHDF